MLKKTCLLYTSVSVNIPFLSETTKQNDLSVDKSYVGYDKDTKKVTYKLDIKSYNGSGDGDINVTDMLYYTDSSLIKDVYKRQTFTRCFQRQLTLIFMKMFR